MATVSDVLAQASFNVVNGNFTDHGDPILALLQSIANAAISEVGSQTFVTDAEFDEADQALVSPLLGGSGTNALHDLVRRELETGEFGLSTADEDRFFTRLRERENRVMASAVDEANLLFLTGGFTQPTGAASAALGRIYNESRDKVISAGREMAMKKVDLHVDSKKNAVAAAVQIDQNTMALALDKFFKIFSLKVDQFKSQLQAQAALATAGMSGLNVNLGLSLGASASVGGSETVSESYDKTAKDKRLSETHSYDETKGVETHSDDRSYIDYHTTTET